MDHPSSYRKGALGRGLGTLAGLNRSKQELSFHLWFRQKAQSITIAEDLVPGSEVVRVQARGINLLYEIISPRPSSFYSIGQGEGRSEAGMSVTGKGRGTDVTPSCKFGLRALILEEEAGMARITCLFLLGEVDGERY